MSILIAIPAAGTSRRMRGGDKLLEEIDGEPLLRRQARAALATGHPVLVLLPAGASRRRKALQNLDVDILEVADAAEGMSASLRLATRHAADHEGLAILLPDVPGIGTAEIKAVLDAYAGEVATRATDPEGRPGTPIVVPPRLFPAFDKLTGDDGGRGVLLSEEIRLIAFEDDRATRDLDTPEDWADWRSNR